MRKKTLFLTLALIGIMNITLPSYAASTYQVTTSVKGIPWNPGGFG